MSNSARSSLLVHPSKMPVVLLLILALSPMGFTPNKTFVSAPNTYILATNGDIITLDPALAYDTASGEVIQNIYETLVFYDGENTNSFVPLLADAYMLSLDERTWTFHIREGVTFHNGASLTASDVAYTFQRGLLQGGYNSPQALLAEPFFGVGIDDISLVVDPSGSLADDRAALQAWDPTELHDACQQVKDAFVVDDIAGEVTMTLAQPWGPFLGTIAQTWGSILDQDWTISNGGWDGSCDTWQNWYAMSSGEDTLTGIANGTGPFILDHWTPGNEIVLVNNTGYWREPAKLERVELKIVPDDTARFTLLQTGAADEARPVGDVASADGMVGEDCVWNIATEQYDCSIVDDAKPLRRYIGRPTLSQSHVLFNFDIFTPEGVNPFIGSGQLDGNGIPTDFFADGHIRKAFNYCFDWDTFGQTAYGGEFVQGTTLVLEGMPGYDLDAPHYTFDLTQCETELGLADLDHDEIPSNADTDDVTQVGFNFQIPYNEGNLSRQTIAEILSTNFAQIDPIFVIDVVAMTWEDYLAAQRAGQIPVMTGGWLEDIHDPHNWYVPYLIGTYANRSHSPEDLKDQFRTLIYQGVSIKDFAARHAIYQQLNQLVYDNAPLIILGGTTGHTFIQRRVNGRILNPIFPGNYYYTINIPPVGFSKTAPANGATNQLISPTLSWGISTKASSYEYCIYPGGGTPCADDEWIDSSTGTIKTLNLLPATTYYWHVRAVNASGVTYANGSDTAYWSFTTRSRLSSYSTGTYDGWVLESTEGSNAGGTMNAAATTLFVGDDAANKQYVSIMHFNTNIPATATITKVTFKIKRQAITGTNPFLTHGNLIADIRKGYFGLASLQLTDFQAPASRSNIGRFTNLPSEPGWYQLVLGAANYTYINRLGVTQFRLRFITDDNNDHGADYVSFYSGQIGVTVANRPVLIIEYTAP